MVPSLTKRQREILVFIESFIGEKGYSPSLEEICSGVGLSSLATVHVHLRNLEGKKMLRRARNRSRSIELTPAAQRQVVAAPSPGVVEVPLLGTVAAGAPIEAVEERETVELPREYVHGDDTFVLRVRGESMIEDHICDGDLVIVESRTTAEEGETVVALVNGSEATVKRFHREGPERVRLEPANAAMEPLVIPAAACTIQGVVIGLLRKY